MTERLQMQDMTARTGENLAPALSAEQQAALRVSQALTDIRENGDTFDVFARRIHGTSTIKTRAAVVGSTPSGIAAMLGGDLVYMWAVPTAWVGGVATLAVGATIAGGAYGVQRLREKGKAAKAEQAQGVIRDYLGEEVDVIRNVRRKDKGLTLRWFGGDEEYGAATKNNVVQRFARVVAFAETQPVRDIVVSASILEHDSTGKLAAKLKPQLTNTAQVLQRAKGAPIGDRLADADLLRLTPAQARQVLEKLNKTTATEALTDWFLEMQSEHPLAKHYATWKELGNPVELKGSLAEVVRSSIERYANAHTLSGSTKILMEVSDSKGRTAVAPYRVRTDSTVTAGPHGLQVSTFTHSITSAGIHNVAAPDELASAQPPPTQPSSIKLDNQSYEAMLGMPVPEYVKKLLELKEIADAAKNNKDTPEANVSTLSSDDQLKLQIALYYLYRNGNDADTASPARTKSPKDGATPQTLFERMTREKPVSALFHARAYRTRLRSRGSVPKDEQTIEYKRMMGIRTVGKKAIAATVSLVVGVGGGLLWEAGRVENNKGTMTCENTDIFMELKLPLTPEELEYCDSDMRTFYSVVGTAADAVRKGVGTVEDEAILKLYEMGWLTPDNVEDFSRTVSDEWLKQKTDELGKRFNLYGDSRSSVIGDAETDGNPAIWDLKAYNGATTNGYWPSSMQNHLTLQATPEGDLLPLEGIRVTFDKNSPDYSAPIGTVIPERIDSDIGADVAFIRPLTNLPAKPVDNGQQLISAKGRLINIPQDRLYLTGNPGEKNFPVYDLPVLQGADLVALNIVIRNIRTDAVIDRPVTYPYQTSDGIFHVALTELTSINGYLDVEYWIEPQATSDILVHAEKPIEANQIGEGTQLLKDVLGQKFMDNLTTQLGVNPDASIQEIAEAIHSSRIYSFNPYKDDGGKPSQPFLKVRDKLFVENEDFLTTREALSLIGSYAAEMDSANCNVAFLLLALASGGGDNKQFIAPTTGFMENGDGILSSVESHIWATDNKGNTIDPTPSGGNVQIPKPESFKDKPPQKPATGDLALHAAASLAALGIGFFVGRKGAPLATRAAQRTLHARRRRRSEKAREWFDGSNPERDEGIALLRHMVYAPPTKAFVSGGMTVQVSGQPSAERQIAGIPGFDSRKALTALVRERQRTGQVEVTRLQRRMLAHIVAQSAKARSQQL